MTTGFASKASEKAESDSRAPGRRALAIRKFAYFKVLATGLAVVGFAHASPALLFPSSSGLFMYDQATGTSAFAPDVGGVASFSGSLGDYTLAVTAGKTELGGSAPFLELVVSNATTSVTGDQLLVFYSDGSFGPSFKTYTLTSYETSGAVSSFAYRGANYFDESNPLGGSGDVAGAVTNNAVGTISASAYYLTVEDVISGNAAGVDSALMVPEPNNLLACGGVVLLIGMALRRLGKPGKTRGETCHRVAVL